jgi:hypothetical protein
MSQLQEEEEKRDRVAEQLQICLAWFQSTKPPIDENTCLKLREELKTQQRIVDGLTRGPKLTSLGINDE